MMNRTCSGILWPMIRAFTKDNTTILAKPKWISGENIFKSITNSSRSSYMRCQLLSHHRYYGTESNKDVSIMYHSGLPVISVPLPSRQENCKFTLRPVSSTVGDFLDSLKREDKGIDRAGIYASDGCRVASDTAVEHLLQNEFLLKINENSYTVEPPNVEHMSSEEAVTLDHVKVLITQLYSQLHLDQHQLTKERELLSKLEILKEEKRPLEEVKSSLAHTASRRTRVLMWAGLAGMAAQFGILARLTWWEYSWDIMEPVTYFITYGTAIIMYGYFVLTQQEYIYPDARDRQYLRFFHREVGKTKFDIERYNKLCDLIAEAEQDLKRLRDPLQLQLPIEPIRTEKMKELNQP